MSTRTAWLLLISAADLTRFCEERRLSSTDFAFLGYCQVFCLQRTLQRLTLTWNKDCFSGIRDTKETAHCMLAPKAGSGNCGGNRRQCSNQPSRPITPHTPNSQQLGIMERTLYRLHRNFN
eukprot:5831851-Pyramimonas_sp.AAC.1